MLPDVKWAPTANNRGDLRWYTDSVVALIGAGQYLDYHVGFLIEDRKADPRLHWTAERMLEHGCPNGFTMPCGTVIKGTGLGRLVQFREGKRMFRYRFIKNRKRQPDYSLFSR